MHKRFKLYLSVAMALIIVVLCTFNVSKNTVAKAADGEVNLVFDAINYNDVLPKNFRKTTDLCFNKDMTTINLKGMDKLNISGSQQFSGNNLPLLIKAIDTKLPITVMDLRQESHGFINGYAVSWADAKNNANVGLTKEQVLQDETNKLKSIKLNVPITLCNHPKAPLVPTSVQDENQLVTLRNLSYNRITVRDGGIPTDDMVDYFIQSIKTLPKDSWLHFHCKQGIGRTSTFMIMYDMMKNYKVASAEEIIKRQIALANYKETTEESFYNPERIGFLNKFYEYCKANGDNFNVKWSEWKKAAASTASALSSTYIKNPVIPTSLYVVSLDSMSSSERTMITSLQGLVNGRCSSQIYTRPSSQPDYKIWLEDLKNNYNVSYKVLSDPWELLKIYKSYIDGYVLYSSKNTSDPSINNACSFASLNSALVIDEDIEYKVRQYGISSIKSDCRNTDVGWAFNNLWDKGLNHSIVIQLSPDKAAPLRDYAIMTKSLIFYENSIKNTTLREKIFSSLNDNSICLGWGPDEFINVSTASKYGTSVVAADWSYNLTTLSAFPSLSLPEKPSASVPSGENFHYVTFIMSDGDNQQWNLGTNYGSDKWFGNPDKGKLNLGWSMTPSLYYLAPTVFNLYNKKSNFIVSPSGNGYMYPSKFDKKKLSSYINTWNDYMKKVDQKYVSIIDDSSFNNLELWNRFTESSNIQGLFYLDYARHDRYQGKILWSNNKPVISCRDLLWSNLEDENELVKRINNRVSAGETDVSSPKAYTFVYVHVWSKGVNNVEEVVNKLNENPNIRVVTPETFVQLIKRNVKH